MWNKNKAFRIYVIVMLLVMIGIVTAFNIYMQRNLRQLSEDYYNVIAALLENVREQYPDFREEEWIQLLNQENSTTGGRSILEQYGLYPEELSILSQCRFQTALVIGGNLFLFLLCGVVLMLLFIYQKKRDRQIEALTIYIRRIEQGIYTLDMKENREDELSSLKNELYKITVMLKESAELSQNQRKALADSVSDISHQLKTPLTSCMVLLDNLSEGQNMEEETRRRFLAEITRQLTNVNWLVVTLLKLSRLDAGVVELEQEVFQLDSLVDEVFDNLAMLAEWKQITFKKEGMAGITVCGDAHWIGEAITNLVKNAIEHSPEGKSVVVQVQDNSVYTSVSVIDFGNGIPEEEQAHIFERFYRSSTTRKDSVGIGLALCKEIVERQNGYITLYSEPGKGTKFIIKFIKN